MRAVLALGLDGVKDGWNIYQVVNDVNNMVIWICVRLDCCDSHLRFSNIAGIADSLVVYLAARL